MPLQWLVVRFKQDGFQLGFFMRWRQKMSLYFFGKLMDRARGLDSILHLAGRARHYDRQYVADRYYRPTGFAWKQAFKRPRRKPIMAELTRINLTELSPADRLAVLGVRYRLALLSGEDHAAIRGLEVDTITSSGAMTADLLFDLLLLLHVVEDWAKLAVVAERVLGGSFADISLRDLAADMLVQARYQLIKLKIFQNTVTQDDVRNVASAIQLTEEYLGESHPKQAHYQGLLAAISGDLIGAVGWHADAPANTGYSTQFFRAATNLVPLADMKAFADKPQHALPEDCWHLRHTGHGECSLVSTDQGYFSTYFEGFLESFSLLNPGALLHVHAVDFSPASARIKDLEGRYGVHINITRDPQSLGRLNPDLRKGYCAGARYMYLPQYLQRYSRVIIHDIDGVLETSMADVWQGRDASIMISSLVPDADRRAHFAFWQNIGAGAFAIAATPENLKFGTALSGYLQSRFDICQQTGGRFFFTDQVGLLLATLAFKDECSIVRMPAIFSQSSDTRGQKRGQAKKEAQEKMLEKLRKPNA